MQILYYNVYELQCIFYIDYWRDIQKSHMRIYICKQRPEVQTSCFSMRKRKQYE